ncbi:MAG: cation transporter [Promethearchaeota archaeon]|nr:MAG: cation transporter [Candidatus Lokiarchaeota archaeon]
MKDQIKLATSALVTSLIFIAELLGGIFFNSLSLLSDSFHVIIDISALLMSLLALKFALKEKHGEDFTFGYHRIEVFAAIINAFILGITVYIIIQEAISRFLYPVPIEVIPTIIIAIIGISANLVSMFILRAPHSHHEDVNIKSAFYHVIGDTLASVGVIVGTTIILFTNFYWIDTVIALLIAGILMISIYRILRSSLGILMQKSSIKISEFRDMLYEIEDIEAIHDLHFWFLCSHIGIFTAHVCTTKEKIDDFSKISNQIKEKLDEKFKSLNIHVTIQFEKMGEHCTCDLSHRDSLTCPLDEHEH